MLDHEGVLRRPVHVQAQQPGRRAELTPEGPDIGVVLLGGTIL